MRKIMLPLVFLSAVFALGSVSMVGCGGDDSSNNNTTKKDFAVTKPDLLQVVDSAVAGPGCAATIQCENACFNDTTKSDQQMQDCGKACDTAESNEGAALEKALTDCIATACGEQPVVDAGMNGPCAYDPVAGTLIDANACNTCYGAQQMANGSCYSDLMACLNDTTGS